MRWRAFLGAELREGLLLGYVSGNGGAVTLTVHPDGGEGFIGGGSVHSRIGAPEAYISQKNNQSPPVLRKA